MFPHQVQNFFTIIHILTQAGPGQARYLATCSISLLIEGHIIHTPKIPEEMEMYTVLHGTWCAATVMIQHNPIGEIPQNFEVNIYMNRLGWVGINTYTCI